MSRFNKKVVLAILDGWGIGPKDKFNAIDNAKTPNFDKLIRDYPNIRLRADGKHVGLPKGQFGTSEINHQIIGAGRVILQDLPKINKAISDKTFFTNKELVEACEHVKRHNSKLHLAGILSDGNVHASIDHVLALIKLAKEQGVKKLYLHVFSDGRDVPPQSVEKYLKIIDEAFSDTEYKIATMQGRFYLDRDRDWDKTKKAIDLIFSGKGNKISSWQSAVNLSYNNNETDEFFTQYLLDENGLVESGDSFVFFHYRSDRAFQIIKSILDKNLKDFYLTTFIEISEDLKTHIAFPRPAITHTLAQSISEAGKSQLHISETEKYTHLTYFLNGGRETEFDKETWARLQSNRYVKPFYNFEPSMRAFDITDEVIDAIKKDKYDFIVINYPNTDMVGHTGNYEAAVIATESVDYVLGKLYKAIKDKLDSYTLIITADHGNSDQMWDYKSNQPHTQHTLNPVPFILVSDINCKLDKKESLEDIAPTVLDLMGIDKPEVMTGNSLILPK